MFTLYFDGCSKGNPGPAAGAYIIKDPSGQTIARGGKFISNATNNQAEYAGLIEGLKKALSLGIAELEVRGDSQLVIRQMEGTYRVKKPDLKPLWKEAFDLSQKFSIVVFKHIPRDENKEADTLANNLTSQPRPAPRERKRCFYAGRPEFSVF